MKTIAFIMVACICSLNVFSQDTLYMKSGKVINGKVTEVNTSEVKYKKASNPDGPVYILEKSDVTLIHYNNGSKDVFSTDGEQSSGNDDGNKSATVINNNYGGYGPGGYWGGPAVSVAWGVGFPLLFNPWCWGGGWRGWRGGYYGGGGGYHRHHHSGGGHHGGHYGRR